VSNDTTVYTTYPEAQQGERGRYFDGQFLTSQDFVDEQRYHIDRLRRALDHLTVSGVSEGLDLTAVGPWKLKLSPGVAIDGVGRQLVVLTALAGVDVPKDIPGGALDVALYYSEVPSRIHGGTSDEDGTRGASRWRELPALEFYAAGQPAPHPEGVPLARLRLTDDGAVTFDSPSPVRRASGLRLPSSGPNFPTLRAGFVRPQLLALTGDLQVTGKLGVGTPDPEGELDVRGLARIGQLSLREQPFKVAGDEASFYPIVFRDLDWAAGQCTLEIVRPNAQTDAASAGSLMARLLWHAADGHGSDLLDVDVVQTRRFVANARLLAKDRLLVIWLRGNRSYAWRANQRVELVDGNAAAKTFNGEKLDPRTNLEPAFDRDRLRLGPTLDREELRGSVSVTGDLAIAGLLARLDVAENPAATIRAADLLLGHGTRRGSPGRALVDASKDALYLNYNADWPLTVINSKAQITGTLVVDGEAKFNKDVILATNLLLPTGGLTVAKPSAFTDQVTITRDNEPLRLIRAKSNAGGARMFLELFQDDTNPATTPETNPFIRFHHSYRWYSRIEGRSTGFHLLNGDGTNYVDLTTAAIKATGNLATDGTLTVARAAALNETLTVAKAATLSDSLTVARAATLSDTLTVARAATLSDTLTVAKAATLSDALTVAKWATFADNVRVTRDAEHLTLYRPRSANGGARMFLELYQDDSSPAATPETSPFIRFHHANRYWHRLEARVDGLHVRDGNPGSNDLKALTAGDMNSNGRAVVTGNTERLRIVRGIVDQNGAIAAGTGFAVMREYGLTRINFTPGFSGTPSVVVSQQYPNDGNLGGSGNTLDNAVVVQSEANYAWVKTGNGNGDQTWRKFHFIAVGP